MPPCSTPPEADNALPADFMSIPSEINIDQLTTAAIARLEPGQTLFIRLGRGIPPDEHERLATYLAGKLPTGVTCLLLDPDAKVWLQ